MVPNPNFRPPRSALEKRIPGVIQVHIDPLWAISRTFGLPLSDEGFVYQHVVFSLLEILEEFGVRGTFFVIGKDLLEAPNRAILEQIARAGHEIGNHSFSHPIGFRFLSPGEKEKEIVEAERLIRESCGVAPAGFAAPAYDVDQATLRILEERGYLYDTSLYPSYFSFFAKCYRHLKSISLSRPGAAPAKPSSWGRLSYMFAPRRPFHPSPANPVRRGRMKILEIPFSSIPLVGMPFYHYFCLFAGEWYFRLGLNWLRRSGRTLNYLIHPTELLDAERMRLHNARLVAIPTIDKPYRHKREFLRLALREITSRYRITTLKEFAENYPTAK